MMCESVRGAVRMESGYMKYVAVALAAVGVSTIAFAAPKESIVLLDEMDHLSQRTELFNEGARVRERRSGCLQLHFTGEKGVSFHRNCFRISRSPVAKDWSLYFLCRFNGKDLPREFGLRLSFGDPKKPDTRLVTVREAGSSIEGGPAPSAPKEGQPGFLFGWGVMNSVALTVHDGQATLWTTRAGRLVAECTGPLPAKPLIGWNLVATAEKTDICFDRLMIVDGVARPYERGDLQEVIAELKTAKPDAWDASFGAAMKPGETTPVDLTKNTFEAKFRAPFTVQTEKTPAVGCVFELVCGEKSEKIAFTAKNLEGEAKYRVYRQGKFVDETFKTVVTNGALSVTGARLGVHALPPIREYGGYLAEEQNEIIAAEAVFRKPAERVYSFAVQAEGPSAYRVLVNGQFLKTVKTAVPVTGVRFTGGAGAEARCAFHGNAPTGAEVWPLTLPNGGFKLERVRENLGSYMLECNHYLSRL